MGYTLWLILGLGVVMAWKESSVMNERVRFVSRLLEGEAMLELDQEFEISRKTGYKLYKRYDETGTVTLARLVHGL